MFVQNGLTSFPCGDLQVHQGQARHGRDFLVAMENKEKIETRVKTGHTRAGSHIDSTNSPFPEAP